MSGRLVLLWYHARLGLSWAALVPPLALAGTLAILSLTGASNGQRSYYLAVLLEVVLPLLAALLAAPLLMAERERNTLSWLATRTPLHAVVALRLALLALYLLACCALAMLAARLLWHGPWLWEALPRAAAPALAFATLALLTAHWGRGTVHGYVPTVALWLGVLMVGGLLPHHAPWPLLNPFAWTFAPIDGASPTVVAHSKLLYAAVGLALLLPQWVLLRPERLLRQT
jgi:hypothetical protein